MTCEKKIVVFDLDETLGYFIELGMFWDALKGFINQNKLEIKINQQLFNTVLDLFPEFLRPNILGILNYLKKKKQKNHCDKLMIYTNNQGPEEWAKFIMNYFDHKLKFKIFDQLIAAFKVKGKQIELCRTTHMKTHTDFVRCTNIPPTTEICFLDDVFYPGMNHDNIYYINIKPYIYDLEFNDMLKRLVTSNILGKLQDPEACITYMTKYMNRYNFSFIKKSMESQMVDKILSKKILNHLHIFFLRKNTVSNNRLPMVTNITKKKKNHKNKTIKIRRLK